MTRSYDLIVIGAGAAGLYLSISMRTFGFRVLLIDRSAQRFGGDCLNVGCVPSKALLHVARTLHAARAGEAFGLTVRGEVDMERVADYLDACRATIRRHEDPAYLRTQGIEVAIGEAAFVSRNAVEVAGTTYTAHRFVLATGSVPRPLQVPGADTVSLYTNETLFDLRNLPRRLLVVGGGPVGVEMSQAFCRLGTAVTVVDGGERILSHDPPEVAAVLQEQLRGEGITFHHRAHLEAFTAPDTARVRQHDDTVVNLHFDAVLAAVGRTQSLDALHLERADVATRDGQIVVDDYLQTSNPRVFVAGDAAGQLQFTHAAELHGKTLLNNFFAPALLRKKVHYRRFSWVTFTDPEVATFGRSEQQLQDDGVAYEKLTYDFAENDRAVIEGYPWAKMVLYTEKSRHLMSNTRLLGGSVVAPHAGEMIQEFITLMEGGLGSNVLFNKIYPYPVRSGANQQPFVERFLSGVSPLVQRAMRVLY